MNARIWQLIALFAILATTVSLIPGASAALAKDPGPLTQALGGKYKGTTVTVGGMWEGEQALGFEKTFDRFEKETSIDVQYQTVKETDASLATSLEAGKGPDIVEFSTPSHLADFVQQGKVVDLTTFLDKETLQAGYDRNWLDWATMAGPNGPIVAGVWADYYVDSLVWYPKAAFEKAGYQVPLTWQELLALSDQIVKDGGTPWCIENNYTGGNLAGLSAVSWLQDILLRTSSLEDYDRWTRGELKSISSQLRHAAQLLSDI